MGKSQKQLISNLQSINKKNEIKNNNQHAMSDKNHAFIKITPDLLYKINLLKNS